MLVMPAVGINLFIVNSKLYIKLHKLFLLIFSFSKLRFSKLPVMRSKSVNKRTCIMAP